MESSSWLIIIPVILPPLILEVLWFLKEKKSFHVYILHHSWQIVKELGTEIIEDDSGKKLCGYAVALEVFIFLVITTIFIIYSIFNHNWIVIIIFAILLIFLPLPILLFSFWINQRFIAFMKNINH
ncbi:hypothetical protein KAU33_06590 [Candidatus Dependentiae bacterium]|nr:hypothetical protein [Candidatus Dependentiae bacterium]